MSELIITRQNQMRFRHSLLATVSALALCGAVGGANAAESDHPALWIEIGGQFTQEQTGQDAYSPPFLQVSPFDKSVSSLEKGAHASWDGTAKLAYETDSGWLISVAVLYGKTNRNRTLNHQTTHGTKYSSYYGRYAGLYAAYQHFKTQSAKDHTIVDFRVGKDVGLGMFGNGGHSVLSAGLRIAQFNSREAVEIRSQPTNVAGYYGAYHIFRADFDAKRRFSGIGPAISWDASTNIIGNSSSSTISLDWGVNAALLFGRQSTKIHHETTDNYKSRQNYISTSQTSGESSRSKNVTVPNLGGFAGVSWRAPNAKVSLGYRADFFFSAMDGGSNTQKSETLGFFGPFASVSVGLGG